MSTKRVHVDVNREGEYRMAADLLASLRAQSLDDRALYFDHDPAAPGSPRTERALHVRLREHAREAADAAISAERADELLAELLKPAAPAEPATDDPQAAQLSEWVACHWPVDLQPGNVRLACFPETGRGLTSRRDLRAGDAAYTVPERLLL
eukprot:3494947-Prymnesium_polylepis.1